MTDETQWAATLSDINNLSKTPKSNGSDISGKIEEYAILFRYIPNLPWRGHFAHCFSFTETLP
jgi:hypothetical protein